MLKQVTGKPITPKEAVGLRLLAPVKRAADTQRGITKNVELDKATSAARGVIADKFPKLTERLGDSERAITASQLRMPLRVNRTNPNQISGLTTTLGAALGFVDPRLLIGSLMASPLAMGVAGAAMGQLKRSIPKLARRGIQRAGSQTLARALDQ
jgi:hypothetical protein